MRTKFLFLCILMSVFFGGCSTKEKIIYRCEIPNTLLQAPRFNSDRELKTQSDYALFMLDIYSAYEKCTINLQSIKKLSDENDRG